MFGFEEENEQPEFPKEIEIHYTREKAIKELGYDDEDELDEDAQSNVDCEIGQSIELFVLNSWEDMPKGYSPVDPNEAVKYDQWLSTRE